MSRRDDELARGRGDVVRFVVGIGMSAANDRATDVVFAQLTGAYWLSDTGVDRELGRAVPAPQNGLRGDTGRGVADRLARWRKVMMPVAVFTVMAALVAVTCA
ncbi:hypothetical protein AB0D42_40055 [Streptomyces sp. NPDC048304]|uniref:hypothetical protein n=1 Tax=Streptomyces sp. NPDC048304 TaxID=3154820 RepID=UPI0033EFBF90